MNELLSIPFFLATILIAYRDGPIALSTLLFCVALYLAYGTAS